MNLTLADSYLLTAFSLAVVALMTITLLWKVRGPAVFLWVGGGLLQAAASVLMVEAGAQRPNPWVLAAVAGAAAAALLAKMASLARVFALPFSYRLALAGLLGWTVLVGLLEAWLAQDFIAVGMLLVGVVLLHAAFVLFLRRTLGRLPSPSLRWLTSAAVIQALLLLASTVNVFVTRQDPLLLLQTGSTVIGVLLTVLVPVLTNALFVGLILDLHVDRLREAHERASQAALLNSRYQERERILSDIHDGFGSLLATARIRLAKPESSRAEALQVIDECISDLQLTVDTLHSENRDLPDDLANLRYRMQQRIAGFGPAMHWEIDIVEGLELPAASRLQVMRIVQEAIANALRHAGATNLWVRAAADPGSRHWVITVEDDGRGLAADPVPGRGLNNMRRRARSLEAGLVVGPGATGRGTRVVLTVPAASR